MAEKRSRIAPRTQRVSIRLSVLVDVEALDAEYGSRHTAAEVRDLFVNGALSAITTDGVIVPQGIVLSGNASRA